MWINWNGGERSCGQQSAQISRYPGFEGFVCIHKFAHAVEGSQCLLVDVQGHQRRLLRTAVRSHPDERPIAAAALDVWPIVSEDPRRGRPVILFASFPIRH